MQKASLPDGVVVRVVDAYTEFVGPRNVERIFGISEDRARLLASAGEIELITVRRAGLINGGIRLYRAQSIRDFIDRNSRRRPEEPLEPGQVAKEML
jgi:hypothetical protein